MGVLTPGPLVLADSGALALLTALSRWSSWLDSLQYGLYSNDWWPAVSDNVGRYTPAQFPGYAGLLPASGWGVPQLLGDLGVVTGTPITWTRGAGLGQGWIGGYYVVDQYGVLIMACRAFGFAGTIVGYAGQPISVVPTLGLVTRYQ